MAKLLLVGLLFTSYWANSQFIKDYSCSRTETIEKFSEDIDAWKKYVQKNVNEDVAQKNCAPTGHYNVEVRFMICKDGSVDNVMAITNYGYGMEHELVRVIKQSPKWKPATSNGRLVIAYRCEAFTFRVGDQGYLSKNFV